MSLSLVEEARCAKRKRCSDPQSPPDWHVLIAMPSQVLTTVCYFGASIPEGGEVTTEQWDNFVEAHVANRLGIFLMIIAIASSRPSESPHVFTFCCPSLRLVDRPDCCGYLTALSQQDPSHCRRRWGTGRAVVNEPSY